MRSTTTAASWMLLALPLSAMRFQEEPPTEIVVPDDARAHGLESLRLKVLEEGIPLDPNLVHFVRNPRVARTMGKALFWDSGVGSDGVQACATCHFHAGADSRSRNQVNPDLVRVRDDRDGDVLGFFHAAPAADTAFEVRGPEETLARRDFPFVRDIGNGANVIEVGGILEPSFGNSNDIASSQGVHLTEFVSVTPGALVDEGVPLFDPVFNAHGRTVRRVEPRNTPTTINAVFSFFNFWDGRADDVFNGVNPFGHQDPDARVFRAQGDTIVREKVELRLSSLASQAVGPPLSDFEMSFAGRSFAELGRKMLVMQPLASQEVAPDDSLLAPVRHPSGFGLSRAYFEFVRTAFHRDYWMSDKRIYFPEGGEPQIVELSDWTDPSRTYHLMEANFALFYGISVMLYEHTLVADRTAFDRWMESSGNLTGAFGPNELAGLNLFVGKGACINCHSGPELTGASARNAQNGNNVIEPMLMGDRRPALYDNGFYNIGVTPTPDDIGRGGANLNGQPLASSRQLLFEAFGIQDIPFDITGSPIDELVEQEGVLGALDEDTGEFIPVCIDVDGDGRCGEEDDFVLRRNAVDGAFKTPGLRNVMLTGPYFHNGSMATLMEVVDFYDRGGNFCRLNGKDLDPDIQPIGFSDLEKRQLVAFLISLTDGRVRAESVPFDHPSLRVPNGSLPDGTQLVLEVPAIGRRGRQAGDRIGRFLDADPFGANPVTGDTDEFGDVACSPNFEAPE